MFFEWKHRVLPEEVDAFKVVHFSNYFKWCSAALIEYFHENGLGLGIFDNGDTEIRVGRINATYIESARLNDVVTVIIKQITNHRNSIQLKILIKVDDKLLNRTKMTVAFVNNKSGILVETPGELKSVILQESTN